MTAFFMLSGYSMVISNGYKNYNNLDEVISFYKKRFISIYPLYFVAGYLGVIMYIMMGTQSITDNLLLFPIELLCIQSFFDTLFPFAHNGGSWFISCLVVGYFIFPWINLLLNNLRTKKLISLLFILIFLLAYSPFLAEHFNTSNLYTNPFFRSMEFVVGMIIARINTSEFTNRLFRFIKSPWAFILSVLFLFFGISFFGKYHIYLDWLPITFVSIILFGAGSIKFPSYVNNRIILYLSSISYAFYLGQKFVWIAIKVVRNKMDLFIGNGLLIMLSLFGCMLSAIILYEFVEKKAEKRLKPILLEKKTSQI